MLNSRSPYFNFPGWLYP